MKIMAALVRYRELEQRLFAVRRKNNDAESPEEDAILDAMDPVWWELTEEERVGINLQKSRRVSLVEFRDEADD